MEDSADMGVEDYGEPQPGTVVFLKSGAVSILWSSIHLFCGVQVLPIKIWYTYVHNEDFELSATAVQQACFFCIS